LVQWWHIKPIVLYVGIPFAVAGVVSLVGSVVSGSLISGAIHDIPPEIMSILPQLITDTTRPLQIYGIALLITGIGLIVLSIKLNPPSYVS
jgi:NADH:ubiquinone oxidoreductase subunit 6 (subunit J)